MQRGIVYSLHTVCVFFWHVISAVLGMQLLGKIGMLEEVGWNSNGSLLNSVWIHTLLFAGLLDSFIQTSGIKLQ